MLSVVVGQMIVEIMVTPGSDAPLFVAAGLLVLINVTVSSNNISLLTVIVNSKNNSKTSSKQQNIKLIEEKC